MRPALNYVEWGSERARSEQPGPSHICEPDDPFADPAVRQRIAEFIVRAALGEKKSCAGEWLN